MRLAEVRGISKDYNGAFGYIKEAENIVLKTDKTLLDSIDLEKAELFLKMKKYKEAEIMPVLRHAYQRLVPVILAVNGDLHIEVVPAADGLPLRVLRLDSDFAHQRLVEGGQALLTVQDEGLGHNVPKSWVGASKWTGLKPYVLASGLQQHHSADWERYGDTGQEALDPVVVPNPAALEVWELEFALVRSVEQPLQGCLSAVEAGSNHDLLAPPRLVVVGLSNASAHLLPEARARHERRLEAVRCSAILGVIAEVWRQPLMLRQP